MMEESDIPPKPTSLVEAHAALLHMLTPEQIEDLRLGSLDHSRQYHHGFGTFIRNAWIRRGPLGQVFAGINPGSIDGMSTRVLEYFISKLRGQAYELPTRVAEMAAESREYYLSMKTPDKVSPIDSAPIKWVIVKGHGQGAIHTGVSTSDGTCWRWVYGGYGAIEPATAEEAERLKSLT